MSALASGALVVRVRAQTGNGSLGGLSGQLESAQVALYCLVAAGRALIP